MFKKYLGLEALIQQGRSVFFTDLTALFQKSQDVLKDRNQTTSLQVLSCLRKMGFDVDLKKIIDRHLGITLKRISLLESNYPNLMCSMLWTDAGFKQLKKQTTTQGMAAAKIANFYNDRTGKFSNPAPKSLPAEFEIELRTGLWTLKDSQGDFYFTAAELAAATLHEIGHVVDFSTNWFRIRNQIVDASDILDYLGTHPDKEVVVDLISRIKQSPYLDKSWHPIVKQVEAYFSTTNSFDDERYWEALSSLLSAVTADVSSRNLIGYNDLYKVISFDQQPTRINMDLVDAERQADEFSSRNGAYADLTSMLNKFHQLDDVKSYVLLSQSMWKVSAMVVGLMMQFQSLFNVASQDICNGYDPLIRRLSLIIETAKHAFHNTDLSESAKADIRSQIVQAESYLAQYQSIPHQKVRAALKSWKDQASKLGKIVASPVQNRLFQDYERLYDATRGLSRHPLYYLSDTLK